MSFAIIEGDVTLRSAGIELAVDDATALPANTRGFIGVGYDGANTRFIRVDTNGHQYVVSNQLPATLGQKAMAASLAVVLASDQSAIPVSQSGTWTVQQGTPPWAVRGTDADGAAPTQNPVLVAGWDETNVQTLKLDTTGHAEVVGPAADGATPVGNPVLTAGYDGTNVQTELTDTSGRQRVVGAAADGAAVTGDPVLVGGQDGANAQSLLTDTSGRPRIVGAGPDGSAVVGDPVQVSGVDGSGNTQSLRTETDGTLRTRNNIEDDRQKLVSVNFGQSLVAVTTYYVFVDLNGAGYKHTPGTKIIAAGAGGKAIKSNSGAKWSVSLMVVLRIDGTNADLGILPIASVALWDTSQFGGGSQLVLFPAVADLGVSGGSFTKITDGMKELNVAAVNTGVTFKDVLGNDVTPAVGDMLLRATLISGGGTLDFVYGMDYWVE